uniref:Uncharacterized protein n=1 Tax=Timema poppense TaxID=170557 RepID=A0A7R9D1Z5_TIMPO|nr:unnamed protein product [Timema poppensis]
MVKEIVPKRMMEIKYVGKSPQGRPKKKWEEQIKESVQVGVLKNCLPSHRAWRAAQTQTLFLGLAFLSSLGVIILLVYIMTKVQASDCGPFRGYPYMYQMILEGVLNLKQGSNFLNVILFLVKPGVVAGVLVAIMTVYYMRAKAQAHTKMVDILRVMLVSEAKDKEFLLSYISRVTEGRCWVAHFTLLPDSSNRMKPKSGDWVVMIDFLQETAIASLSSGSNNGCTICIHTRNLPDKLNQGGDFTRGSRMSKLPQSPSSSAADRASIFSANKAGSGLLHRSSTNLELKKSLPPVSSAITGHKFPLFSSLSPSSCIRLPTAASRHQLRLDLISAIVMADNVSLKRFFESTPDTGKNMSGW